MADPKPVPGDALMTALRLLAAEEGNPSFSAIRWCPKQHVLSFQRAGMDGEWVNLYLHASDLAHQVWRNGSSGGSEDVLLWEDGRWHSGSPVEPGQFVFTLPARLGPADVDPAYADRVEVRDFRTEQP